MSSDESVIILEEINRELEEIEKKYSSIKYNETKNCIQEELLILSEVCIVFFFYVYFLNIFKELDTVGLPEIDISKSAEKILGSVITSCRSLVHLHRKTLLKITDSDLESQAKNRKISDIQVIL